VSHTTFNSAGTYPNTATASADNAPPQKASDTIVVRAPALTITKKADHASVSAGSPIGFTISVSNSSVAGTGNAFGGTVDDPLPAGPGISWSIDPSYPGPGTCTIKGTVGAQDLSCNIGTLAPGAGASVHVTSPTDKTTPCAAYSNTATVSASNHPSLDA